MPRVIEKNEGDPFLERLRNLAAGDEHQVRIDDVEDFPDFFRASVLCLEEECNVSPAYEVFFEHPDELNVSDERVFSVDTPVLDGPHDDFPPILIVDYHPRRCGILSSEVGVSIAARPCVVALLVSWQRPIPQPRERTKRAGNRLRREERLRGATERREELEVRDACRVRQVRHRALLPIRVRDVPAECAEVEVEELLRVAEEFVDCGRVAFPPFVTRRELLAEERAPTDPRVRVFPAGDRSQRECAEVVVCEPYNHERFRKDVCALECGERGGDVAFRVVEFAFAPPHFRICSVHTDAQARQAVRVPTVEDVLVLLDRAYDALCGGKTTNAQTDAFAGEVLVCDTEHLLHLLRRLCDVEAGEVDLVARNYPRVPLHEPRDGSRFVVPDFGCAEPLLRPFFGGAEVAVERAACRRVQTELVPEVRCEDPFGQLLEHRAHRRLFGRWDGERECACPRPNGVEEYGTLFRCKAVHELAAKHDGVGVSELAETHCGADRHRSVRRS